MKRYAYTLGLVIGLAFAASPAQAFENLDFEAAQVPDHQGVDFLHVDWSLAAPGWQHGTIVPYDDLFIHGTHLAGRPWYLLQDEHYTLTGTRHGRYSFAFYQGNPSDPRAWIGQSGALAADIRSMHFYASGDFELTVNGTRQNLIAVGDDMWAADVSAYAGQTFDFRFYADPDIGNMVAIDDVRFSTLPVPEPETYALMGMGLVGIALARRRKHTVG